MTGPQIFLLLFGALLTLIGVAVFFSLTWFKRGEEDKSTVKVLDKIELHVPHALVIFVAGVALMALPFFLSALAGNAGNVTPIPASAGVTPAAVATHGLRGKTVYVFISSELQRNDADALLRRLAGNSAKVYGVENLVKKGSVSPENADQSFPEENMGIRYFYLNDLEAAKSIQELSQRNRVVLDDHTEDPVKNPEGILEVWYPWSKQ